MKRNFGRIMSIILAVLMLVSVVPISAVPISVSAATSNNWSWPTITTSISCGWPSYSDGSYHGAYDFAVPVGSDVYATCDGEVVDIQELTTSYGKHIKIKAKVNGATVYMRYCHLSSFNVSVGDKVRSGQLIAKSGATGNVTGPNLHYEVRDANDKHGSLSAPNLNPKYYLPGTSYTFEEIANFTTNIDNAPSDWQTFDKTVTTSFIVAGWAFRNTNELTRVYYCFDDNGYTQMNPVDRPDVRNVYGNSQLDCGFNQSIDISGLSLGSHTFKIWCSSNGIDYTMYYIGIIITSSDTSAPTISNARISDLNVYGYEVTCTVTDSSGVKRVAFPTWTSNNGQDDIIWHEGSIAGNTAKVWVGISSHNNERGEYITHIYAYDIYDNVTSVGVSAVVPEPRVFDVNMVINDTVYMGGLSGFSFDLYFNGVLYADDTTDFADSTIPQGTKYEIKDIKCPSGYVYTGGAVSGTVNDGVDARLYFSSIMDVEFQSYSESGISKKTVTYGKTYGELPVPVRNGFIFDGWYDQAIGGTKITASSKVTNTTGHALYAHWKTQSVYFDLNYGETAINYFRPDNCFDAATQTLELNGSYATDTIIDLVPFKPEKGEIYKVTVTKISGSISGGFLVLEGVDDGIVSMSAEKYGGSRMHIDIPNSKQVTWTITESRATGLTLLKVWLWASDGKTVSFDNFKVRIKIEKVQSSADSTTEYSPVGQFIKNGSTYSTLPAPARNGYTFDGWYTAASGGTKITTDSVVNVTGNQTLYAHWSCNHTEYTSAVTKNPTCTQTGIKTFTCTTCSHSYTEVISETGHSYSSVVTPPTCTKDGYTTYTCECGDSYVSDTVTASGHNYASAVTKEPTHLEEGVRTYTCHCGDSYTEAIAKIPHSYSAVVTPPTCTEDGYTTYTCECGDSYVSDTVKAKGHSYSAVVTPPTCTKDGYTTYTCECGDSYVSDTVTASGHNYTSAVTKEPTHLEEGVRTYTCHCGDSYTEAIAKIPHSHSAVVTPPTCTEDGYTTYTCECGDSYVSDTVTASGHNYASAVTKEPTHLEEGVRTYTCHCGDSYTEAIAKIPHSYSAVVTPPTCTEDGYTTYTCECGDSYVSDTVKAKGHSYSSEIVTPATHLEEGLMKYTCACGDTYTEVIKKNPMHTYTSETVVAPTCTGIGKVVYTCECGESYTDYVPANGHIDENNDCICDVCGEEFNRCTQMCHNNNPVAQFVWKIIITICKFFGIAKTCSCGRAHY